MWMAKLILGCIANCLLRETALLSTVLPMENKRFASCLLVSEKIELKKKKRN